MLTFWKDIRKNEVVGDTPIVMDTNAIKYIRNNNGADVVSKALFNRSQVQLNPFPSYFPVSLVMEYGGASIASRRVRVGAWAGVEDTDVWLEESWSKFEVYNAALAGEVYGECRTHYQNALNADRSHLSRLYLSTGLKMLDRDKDSFVSSLKIRLIISDLFRTLVPFNEGDAIPEFRKRQLRCLGVQFSTLIQHGHPADFLRLGFEMTQGLPELHNGISKCDSKLCAFKTTNYDPSPNSDLGDSELLELLLLGGRYGNDRVPVRVVTTDPYESVVTRLKIARFVMNNLFERISNITGEEELRSPWKFGTVSIIDKFNHKLLTLDVEKISELEPICEKLPKLFIVLSTLQYFIWKHFRWNQKH